MAEKSLGMHFVFAYMDFFLYLCTRILCVSTKNGTWQMIKW